MEVGSEALLIIIGRLYVENQVLRERLEGQRQIQKMRDEPKSD